ncbi:uncharacterized protein B0J16DRAFT_398863 [Fusarium flagelliforme]|uniref:uncharacterized protein n=1 Tax=Fusarium flagelliforme TaxID=2675880 RepID=UPI001E8D2EF6|nr:uncharacterized protein B0J16DRAFT_398863 [Fusarium flagelliforme]KAH7185142.1 hypothetical protein B0J16DRAFT_398863 [Fusarium flagelliforme]
MRLVLVQALFFTPGLGLSLSPRTNTEIGPFKNPELTPFLQLDLAVGRETNVTAPENNLIMAPNVKGGKVTGAFEADILPIGASIERGFYTNRYVLQTANNDTIGLEVDVIVNYRNNAHHSFGFGKFTTAIPDLLYLNYNMYLVEVTGDFNTGGGAGQIFAFKSGGRRDGEPITALLPVGGEV